jgi:hypothetical protein
VVGEIFDPLRGGHLQPPRRCHVLSGTLSAGDLLVGDVPDERVPEAVLRVSLHRRLAGQPDELLARELVQRAPDLVRVAVAHRADRARPEHFPEHRRVLEEGLPLQGQSVETSRDQPVNRLGDRHIRGASDPAVLVEQVAVAQHAHEFLGVQRVAAGTLEQQPLRLRRQHRLLQQSGDELGRVRVGERREADRGVVA